MSVKIKVALQSNETEQPRHYLITIEREDTPLTTEHEAIEVIHNCSFDFQEKERQQLIKAGILFDAPIIQPKPKPRKK